MIEIISIHIPKTAGRSFLSVLRNEYGDTFVSHFDRKSFPDKTIPEITQFKSELPNSIRAIHGHFNFCDISDLKEQHHAKVITWLRDPVERVISNYSFFKKRIAENPADPELQKRKAETLMEYARMENSRNRMYKFMKGLPVKDYFFIGITEHMAADMQSLAKMLNWKPVSIPRINDNTVFKKFLPAVNNSERREIAELNKFDLELYQEVLNSRL